MGLEFHETVMGYRFFEGQLPQMIQGIEKNNSSIEKLTALLEKQCALLEEQNMLLKTLQKMPQKENDNGVDLETPKQEMDYENYCEMEDR